MKRIFLLLFAALLATSCGDKRPTLRLYTWDDYLAPELVAKFEEEHGCRLVVDIFDSNEAMLAKLQAGAAGYDVLVPSSYMVKILAREGLVAELDHAKLPNLEHVDREYLAELAFDKEMKWSVPYMLAPTGVAYVSDRVEGVGPTWRVFERTDLKGRMTLLNDARETLGAALKTLGHSLNTTDPAEIEAARDLVIAWKANLAKFESDQYDAGLASAEFLVSQAYAGDAYQAQEDNAAIEFFVPAEGTSVACDDLVVSASAPNPDLAHAFIDFLTDPRNAAENMEYISYLAPNQTAYGLVGEEFRQLEALFLDEATMAKCEVIDDLGEHNALYNKAWDEVRAAR